MPGAPSGAVRLDQVPPRTRPGRSGAPIRVSRLPPPPRSRNHGRRRRQARATRPKYNRGADRVSVPYPQDERSRRTIPSLLHWPQVYAIPCKAAARAAFVACRCPPEGLPQNRGKKQSGLRYFKMSAAASRLLICSCEKTMPLDAAAIGRGCTATVTQANQLCGLDLQRFKEALAGGAPITVACTQEEALFREVAENSPQAQLTFVNIRETDGWSKDAAAAGPKAAALFAAAGEWMPPIALGPLECRCGA